MADYSASSGLIFILFSFAFLMQLVAYATPNWACTPSPCDLDGLLYKCVSMKCEKHKCVQASCWTKILDKDIFTLDTIAFISNVLFLFVLPFILKNDVFSLKALVGIGISTSINGILAIAGGILVYARFQTVGWSGNLFTAAAVLFCIIGAAAFMVCIKGTCNKVTPW